MLTRGPASWIVGAAGLVACGRQPCGLDVPIEAEPGHESVVEELEWALATFVGWTDLDVCVDAVELRDDLGKDRLGVATWHGRVLVRVDPGGDSHDEIVWHELCHSLDRDYDLSDRDDLFGDDAPGPGREPIHDDDRTAGDRRGERFASWCETGPTPALVAAREAGCGQPTRAWMNDRVWSGVHHTPVTLTSPVEDVGVRVVSAAFDGELGDTWMIEQTGPTEYLWSVLVDGRPASSFPSALAPLNPVLATGPDRFLIRIGARPTVVTADGWAFADDIGPDWVGGFGAGAWWLWPPDARGPTTVIALEPDGATKARYELDLGYLTPRFLDWDGHPAFVVVDVGGEVTVRELPTGRPLAVAPAWPSAVHDGLLIGETAWHPIDDELFPIDGADPWWVTPDGQFSGTQCGPDGPSPGRREVQSLHVEVGADGAKNLVSTTRRYPLP